MNKNQNIKHGDYTWIYEKADLEQGAYSVCDPERRRVAAILPQDQARPINDGENAWLLTRDFGTEKWKGRGTHTLEEALTLGNEYINKYRAYHQADDLLREAERGNIMAYSDLNQDKDKDMEEGFEF